MNVAIRKVFGERQLPVLWLAISLNTLLCLAGCKSGSAQQAIARSQAGFEQVATDPEPPSRTLAPVGQFLSSDDLDQLIDRSSIAATAPTTGIARLRTTNLMAFRAPLVAPALGARITPDPVQTPGAVFAQATRVTICAAGYTATVRNVTEATKQQVFANYGVSNPKPGQYEIDHLVPLELGGSNDITNLWPEPYFGPNNAHIKDHLENEMHRLVCEGQLDLAEAQTEIAGDWMTAYKKYVLHQP